MKAMNPQLGGKCAEEPSALAKLHNRALANALKKLESKLLGFKYSIFDYYNALLDKVNNASEYGRLWPQSAYYASNKLDSPLQ